MTEKKGRIETYSEGFDGGELLHDRFFLGQISCTYRQGRGSHDWQTDRHTHDQEDKSKMEQAVGAGLGRRELEVVEETTNPGSKNPTHDQNQQRRANGVHDRLEVTLILCARNQGCSASDEGHLGRVGDDGICLSSLAASSIVDYISHVLVDSERFSSHGRLIDGKESIAGAVLLSDVVLVVALVFNVLAGLAFKFLLELGPAVGVVVSRDNSGIRGNNLSVFDNDLERSIDLLLMSMIVKNLQCHREPAREP
jgi:hypothetical protein